MSKEDKKLKDEEFKNEKVGPAKEDEGGVMPSVPNKKGKTGEKVEVDAGLLRELIDKMDRLESNAAATTNQNGIQVRRKVREFDYTVRKWDGKFVLGFENRGTEKRPIYVYDVYDNANRKNVQYCNLILNGVEKPVQVDYITFLRDAERVKVRKTKQVEHEDVKEYGMIPKKDMAENGYGMYETMVMVPVEVISKTYTFTLQLPEDEGGKEIEMESMWVNM